MQLEPQQDIDRRRLLGLLGVGSAAVLVGPGAAAAATRQAVQVDLARVRYEFDAGADAIPLHRLLPDGADATHLEAARESLRFRVRGIARVLIDRNRSSREQLMDAKQAMLRMQREMTDTVDCVLANTISPAEARARVLASFSDYIAVMRSC